MVTIEEKRNIVQKRIARELTAFHAQHNVGMPMQTLAAKYAKACLDLGGFPELVEAMQGIGMLRVDYSSNGARTVWPVDGKSIKPSNSPIPEGGWF